LERPNTQPLNIEKNEPNKCLILLFSIFCQGLPFTTIKGVVSFIKALLFSFRSINKRKNVDNMETKMLK
jgi:hypothetical protein